MSLSLTLSTALTSLQTSQAGLQIVSNNVANATTEGYTRKTAENSALVLDGVGTGVELGQIKRTVDEALLTEIRSTMGVLSAAEAMQPYFSQMQDLFGQPGDNNSIGATITVLANAIEGLAATPEGQTERTEVINAALNMTRQLASMSEEIQRLRGEAERQLSSTVDLVNANLQEIADLNDEIVLRLASQQSAAELEDKRDLALEKLSGYLDVQTFTRSSGEVVVFTNEGTLLDGFPKFLSHNSAGILAPGVNHADGGIDGISLNNRDITTTLQGGALKGLIDLRDSVLPGLQAEIDQLSAMLRDEVNALHNKGTSVPPPTQLSGSRLFDSANDVVVVSGTIRFAAVEANGKVPDNLATAQPFSVDLGGLTAPVTVQDVVDAINTQAAAQPPQVVQAQLVGVGSQVQLQISTLNGNHRLVLDEGDSAVSSFTPNGGTASAVALQNGTAPGFSHFFGLNDFFTSTGFNSGDSAIEGLSRTLSVRGDLVTDSSKIARASTSFSLPLSGGDILISAGDNSIIQSIAAKFDEPLTYPATGNLSATTTTFAGYGSEIVFENATASARTDSNVAIQLALKEELSFRSDSLSGVNIDEELSQMIVIQQAYSASARLVTTVQELFQALQRWSERGKEAKAMATHVSTFAVQQLVFSNTVGAQARSADLQISVSSGEASRDYAGLGDEARELLNVERLRERAMSFMDSIQVADLRLQTAESQTAQALDLAADVRTLLVTATSGANAPDLLLAEQATSYLEQIAGLLNADYDGSYLFGGTRTDVPPVDLDALLNPSVQMVDVAEFSGAATTSGTGFTSIPGIVSMRVESGNASDAFQLTYDGAGNLSLRNLSNGANATLPVAAAPALGTTADYSFNLGGETVVVTLDNLFPMATPITTQAITGSVAGGTGAFGTISLTQTQGNVSLINSNTIDLFSPTADASDVTITLPSSDGNFVATGVDLESATGARDIVLNNLSTGAQVTINVDVTTVISDAAINDPGTGIDLGNFLVNLGASTGATAPQSALPNEAGYDPANPTYYQGDSGQLSVRADEQVTIDYGITAADSGFEKIIRALFITRSASSDPNNINTNDLEQALGLAVEAIEDISNHRSEIGTARKSLESMRLAQDNMTLLTEETISDIENTDIAEALTLLSQNTTTIEAAYSTLSRLSSLSLLEFI